MKRNRCIGFVCIVLLLAGCGNRRFTVAEKKLIRSQQTGIMRLYTTETLEDSLLLRRKAMPIERAEAESEEYRMLRAGLIRTVQDITNPGVSIAAPQVGISRRMIVVQRFDKAEAPFEVYLNPEIIRFSASVQRGPEGCLSVPGARGTVKRADEIVVRYMDEDSYNQKQDTVKGFTAVIFQHETDHLEGILFTDRLEDGDQPDIKQ